MRPVPVSTLRARCFALIERVRSTRESLSITRGGCPVAEIVPTKKRVKRFVLGDMIGTVEFFGDITAPVIDPEQSDGGPTRRAVYNAFMDIVLTAVYEEVADADGGGYVAYVEELPGAITEGDTLDEARENLRDAVELLLEANRQLSSERSPGKTVTREKIKVSVA